MGRGSNTNKNGQPFSIDLSVATPISEVIRLPIFVGDMRRQAFSINLSTPTINRGALSQYLRKRDKKGQAWFVDSSAAPLISFVEACPFL